MPLKERTKLIFVGSPYRDNVISNTAKATRYCYTDQCEEVVSNEVMVGA